MELTERFVVPATVERRLAALRRRSRGRVVYARRTGHGARRRQNIQRPARDRGRADPSEVRRPRDDRARRHTREGRIHIEAVDKRGGSRARGQIVYKVVPEGAGDATVVELVQQVTLSGAAQFGRTGVIEDINAQMTRQFAECLATKLAAPAAAEIPPQRPPIRREWTACRRSRASAPRSGSCRSW